MSRGRNGGGFLSGREVLLSLLFLLVGAGLGYLGYLLRVVLAGRLPGMMRYLDLPGVFGRYTIWIFLGLSIAAFSSAPARAAWNTLAFALGAFLGIYGALYLAGRTLPVDVLRIWLLLTAVSPILAMIAWYGRGWDIPAVLVSALTLGVMGWSCMKVGMWYISVSSPVELLLVIAAVVILGQREMRDFHLMIGGGFLILLLLKNVLPLFL